VKVLIASDLVGWNDSFKHGLLTSGTLDKPIGRVSSELYTHC